MAKTSESDTPISGELEKLLPYSTTSEREELLRLIAEIDYVPYGAALELFHSTEDEVVLSGPAGTGKSRACLEYLHSLAMTHPRSRQLIARKTRESMTESVLVTYEKHVLGEESPICARRQRENRSIYRYPNGSEIVIGGMDKPTKIMSTEFDTIYIPEAIELLEHDWETLTTRLRNSVIPKQRIIGDTNPDRPTHWIKKRADAGRMRMIESRHEDNPTLWANGQWTPRGLAYIAKLDALTGVRKERLRFGRWVGADGLVYEFDEAVHLVDRFEIPKDWRRIRSIDFGYTNPFACQWWAIDPDGRMYLYRELYHTKRLVADHAAQILKLSAGERIEATTTDHDAEDRATLNRAGVPSVPAKKEIKEGIEAVSQRLRKAGDGKPRLFVLRDSLIEADEELIEAKKPYSMAHEFSSYVYPKGQDGKALKEVPVDLDNHGMDAMRYAVMHIDRARTIRIESSGSLWQ